MIGATPIIHALSGGPLRLVSASALSGGLALIRASTALAAGTDGATMLSYATNAPRFQGAAQRLVIEGARTNAIRNPRLEGATVGGTGAGAMWTYFGNLTNGLGTVACVGQGTSKGLPYVDVRFQGTPSGSSLAFTYDSGNSLSISAGTVFTHSIWLAIVGGSLANIISINNRNVTTGGAGTVSVDVSGQLTGTLQRFSNTVTAGNSATSTQQYYSMGVTTGGPVDITLRFACPQLELGGLASTPVLPAAGTPASSTRTADVPVFSLNATRAAAGTLVGTFMLPAVSTAAADVQGLLVLDDGTDANRFGLRKPGGAATLQPFRSVSGTLTSGSSIQTLAPGVAIRAALAWDTSGIVACCNGGTVVSLAGAIPAVSRLLIGHGASTLGQGAFGEVGPLDLHPTRLPDAILQALTLN
ncbi:hypothetical protein [Muricoccus aerilatus]|uniref:hypothetical protein n=1 Tax=Muricoccus aerilatus TaxID=452982 RepID=UPI0005C21488|nr:hypothetical protein [Roseomonas aerilata]